MPCVVGDVGQHSRELVARERAQLDPEDRRRHAVGPETVRKAVLPGNALLRIGHSAHSAVIRGCRQGLGVRCSGRSARPERVHQWTGLAG